ncbi:hypothetical protein RclHR1_02580005 [Rhizophagus clarus]|uniref:Uncharacterized protein n=1 Tax=Rhizophagus clarus TaxID=94130 RepID=A0A2Z6R461_9GLOM|nr:hypothetical protein RclHR1_02580005 [Rhizophagus clarus]
MIHDKIYKNSKCCYKISYNSIWDMYLYILRKGKYFCSKTIQILIGPGLAAYNLDSKIPIRVQLRLLLYIII